MKYTEFLRGKVASLLIDIFLRNLPINYRTLSLSTNIYFGLIVTCISGGHEDVVLLFGRFLSNSSLTLDGAITMQPEA